ncbi:hypothetical protein ACFVH4_18840 [Nocardia ignorata]|uniref:hypothetical protein n=1 Tax=Actinomycetes TaxID=1760 RepID=UPI0036390E3F
MTAAHIVQVFILGVLVGGTAITFVYLVRADLRANPPMATTPGDDEGDNTEDPGAEWDRARDRWIDDREMGAA